MTVASLLAYHKTRILEVVLLRLSLASSSAAAAVTAIFLCFAVVSFTSSFFLCHLPLGLELLPHSPLLRGPMEFSQFQASLHNSQCVFDKLLSGVGLQKA